MIAPSPDPRLEKTALGGSKLALGSPGKNPIQYAHELRPLDPCLCRENWPGRSVGVSQWPLGSGHGVTLSEKGCTSKFFGPSGAFRRSFPSVN